MDFYVWTREGLKRQNQNGVRLAAFRIGKEKDLPGVCASVAVCSVHSGTHVVRRLRCKRCPVVRQRVRASIENWVTGPWVLGVGHSIRTAGQVPFRGVETSLGGDQNTPPTCYILRSFCVYARKDGRVSGVPAHSDIRESFDQFPSAESGGKSTKVRSRKPSSRFDTEVK